MQTLSAWDPVCIRMPGKVQEYRRHFTVRVLPAQKDSKESKTLTNAAPLAEETTQSPPGVYSQRNGYRINPGVNFL